MDAKTRYEDRIRRTRHAEAMRIRLHYDDGITTLDAGVTVTELLNLLEEVSFQLRGELGAELQIYPAIEIAGADGAARSPIRRISFFSAVSKMLCLSWSLPAGPLHLGGSCVHARVGGGVRRYLTDLDRFICHGCYATGGEYIYLNNQLSRAVRMLWLRHEVDDFPSAFAAAFAAFCQKPHYHAQTRSRLVAAERSPQGALIHPAYFRIHDSGDALWGGRAYVDAWKQIAADHPQTRFWMPTRDWPSRSFVKWFGDRPQNLVVRPSALEYEAPAPAVEGLDAGTAVSGAPDRTRFADIDCPAYKQDFANCVSARCRRCWTAPQQTVVYKAHGIGGALARRARGNPDRFVDSDLFAAGFGLDDLALLQE